MKIDSSNITLETLESVIKNAESSRDKVSDDILAILGEDTEVVSSEADDKQTTACTIKDLTREIAKSKRRRRSLTDYPTATKEEDCPDILIKGAWLERGGSAFIVSTAGTGKSILVTQFAISMVQGVPCCGFKSNNNHPLKCWIIQSEDSDRRVAIDRDDIIAGLTDQWKDTYPEIDWRLSAGQVEFVEFTGHTGASFLEHLREELEVARGDGELPDIVVMNPFMDFLGADVTSNADTIAFLSGGTIAQKRTEGLRSILKDFRIAALIVHHTAKPPTDDQLGAWIMSDMPEYKACGASYITNWGRSFVTMLKIPGLEGFNMLTAGKNGAGLGWPLIEGGRRVFIRWVDEPSCGGTGTRHFWKVVTDEEEIEKCHQRLREIANKKTSPKQEETREEMNPKAAAAYWANEIKQHPGLYASMTKKELEYKIVGAIMAEGRKKWEALLAVKELYYNAHDYGLVRIHDKGSDFLRPEDV